MSKTPSGIITTQMATLNSTATNIESDCDALLESNYRGNFVEIDIESRLSTISDPKQVNIVIELVKLKYPKWKIEFFTSTSNTKHRYKWL